MKYKWLNDQNKKELIIFFNGWGMDETIISHLEYEKYDVLMFYDYNTLDTDFDFMVLKRYHSVNLVAWSMGVMIASLFNINYETKTAINGTLVPINDHFGIPKRIYDLTLKNLNPLGVKKFIRNMFNEDVTLPEIKRGFENQKSELHALKEYKSNNGFRYNRVIISSEDKIIPTKNQVAFWGVEPNIHSGHAPFYLYKKWSELL